MALKIDRPGSKISSAPKLSGFGKKVLIIAGLLFIIIIIIAVVLGQNAKKQALNEKPVLEAVERSLSVCQVSLQSLRADDAVMNEFDGFAEKISKEKDARKKAGLATDMIGFVLSQEGVTQSATDELNGALNRIELALRNLK